MTKMIAAITTSVDGYITGPNDGPDKGLGEGGERLHYWVFGGPWSYENEPRGEPEGVDADYLNEMRARGGAIVVGRNMYEAAGHWGGKNPFGMPVFVLTHRPEQEPDTGEFTFVGDFEEAIARAKVAAGHKDVSIGGGADVIRQGLDDGVVDELHIIVAPVILGGGKHLFRGLHEVSRPGEPRRAPIAVGDLHRVRSQTVGAAPNPPVRARSPRSGPVSDTRSHRGHRRTRGTSPTGARVPRPRRPAHGRAACRTSVRLRHPAAPAG